MKNFINVTRYGNKIYHKYIQDGIRVEEYEDFKPSLFFRTEDGSDANYKSLIHEYPLKRKTYESLNDHYSAVRRYKDIGGLLYGDIAPQYQFISEHYNESRSSDISDLRILYIDIETAFEPGVFPEPETAQFEVLTLTVFDSLEKKYIVLGTKDLKTDMLFKAIDGEVLYEKMEDEADLLLRFMELWCDNLYPDMVIGWNSEKFDIPYLYQRIGKLFGQKKRDLSPFGKVISRMKKEEIKPGWFDEFLSVDVHGVNCVDYMKFYKKNILKPRRSYSLDEIAHVELKANKLKHKYANLMDLYNNDYDLYCTYNLIDVDLMVRLNKKVRLLELIAQQAYMAGVNFEDTFSPIKRWDAKLYRELLHEGVVIEPKMIHDPRPAGHGVSEPKLKSFIADRDQIMCDIILNTFVTSVMDIKDINKPSTGGFVMVPNTGLSKDIASFDLNSLYPFIMALLNLGPESLYIPGTYEPTAIRTFIKEKLNGDVDKFIKEHCTHSVNDVYFWKGHESVFSRMLIEHYKLRASIRKDVSEMKNLKKRVKDALRKRGIKP